MYNATCNKPPAYCTEWTPCWTFLIKIYLHFTQNVQAVENKNPPNCFLSWLFDIIAAGALTKQWNCTSTVYLLTKLSRNISSFSTRRATQYSEYYDFSTKEVQSNTTHYDDVIMGAIASQITSLTVVYSAVYSGADQSKHQSSASLAFVWGIHRGPVNSPHKWPVTRKTFPFDDVIMHVLILYIERSRCSSNTQFYRPIPPNPCRSIQPNIYIITVYTRGCYYRVGEAWINTDWRKRDLPTTVMESQMWTTDSHHKDSVIRKAFLCQNIIMTQDPGKIDRYKITTQSNISCTVL